MAARRMLRAFFRSIGWNVAAIVALALLSALVDAVSGDGSTWVELGVLFGVVTGVLTGVLHGVVQAAVALVREPHRLTVASALAAGVSASLVTWGLGNDGDSVPVLDLLTYYWPYVVASPFLARWCHPQGGRN